MTLEATASSDLPGGPAGSVTFRDGTTEIGTAELDFAGVARLELELGWGSHTIAATYGGDAVSAPSVGLP